MQELRRKLLAKQRSRVLYGPGYIMIYLEGLDLNSKWNRQWPSAETVFGCVNLKTHTLTQTHAHMYLYIYIYKYIYIYYIYRKSIFSVVVSILLRTWPLGTNMGTIFMPHLLESWALVGESQGPGGHWTGDLARRAGSKEVWTLYIFDMIFACRNHRILQE